MCVFCLEGFCVHSVKKIYFFYLNAGNVGNMPSIVYFWLLWIGNHHLCLNHIFYYLLLFFANNGSKTSIQTLTKGTKVSAVSHSNKWRAELKISQMFNSGWKKNAEEARHPYG